MAWHWNLPLRIPKDSWNVIRSKHEATPIFFRNILTDKFLFVLWVDEMMKHCKTRFVDIHKLQTTTALGKIHLFVHRRFVSSDSNWFRGFSGNIRPGLGGFLISVGCRGCYGCRVRKNRSFGPWTFTRPHLGRQGNHLSTLWRKNTGSRPNKNHPKNHRKTFSSLDLGSACSSDLKHFGNSMRLQSARYDGHCDSETNLH